MSTILTRSRRQTACSVSIEAGPSKTPRPLAEATGNASSTIGSSTRRGRTVMGPGRWRFLRSFREARADAGLRRHRTASVPAVLRVPSRVQGPRWLCTLFPPDHVLGIAYPKAVPSLPAIRKKARNSQAQRRLGYGTGREAVSWAGPVANPRSAHALASKAARDEIADTRCDVGALRSRSSRGPEPT